MKEGSNFRFDIGLLRALSVLVVVFYHFKVPFFSGGFIGVDVFFVISGFLMTKIILTGFDNQKFNLKVFYINRVKRIIPALLVVLLFVLLISSIFFFASDLKLNSKNSFLSSLFVSNIYYWLYNGYFDPASKDNILLHTWSLSVEWQFYLIYPVLLLFFKNVYLKNKAKLRNFLIFITSLSLVLTLLFTKDYNSFCFYMFPSRTWEMTIGGLAFMFSSFFINTVTTKIKSLIVLLSLLIIGFCTTLIDESFLWPSYFTIIPVLSTFFILTLHVDLLLFKNKFIQFFGNISYSLYLWHWPIFIVFKYFGMLSSIYVIIMFVLSLIFSSLSYFYIEQNRFFSNYKGILVCTALITFSSFSLYFFPVNQITKSLSIYDSSTYQIVNYGEANQKERNQQFEPCGCFLTDRDKLDDFDEIKCLKIDTSKRNILLLGDSHSAEFSQSFREKLSTDNILEVSASNTFPFLNTQGAVESKMLIDYLYNDFIPKNQQHIDMVVLSVHWPMYNTSLIGFEKKELKSKILELVKYYSDRKIKFVFLGQTESYIMPFPRVIALAKDSEKYNYTSYLDKSSKDFNNYLKTFVPKSNYVEIYELKNINKFDSKNSVPYMFDDNHLTKFGTDQVVDYLIKNNFLDQ